MAKCPKCKASLSFAKGNKNVPSYFYCTKIDCGYMKDAPNG